MALIAQNAPAQQFITAINIDYDDTAGAPDVHIDRMSSASGVYVGETFMGADAHALTQLGVNKVYGSTAPTGVELSATSAWLDHFTVAGPVGSTVKMSFSFAIDGNAAFNEAGGITHFNFQVFALRGDGWTLNGIGDYVSGAQNTAKLPGTDYDEPFFQRYVPERDPLPGQMLPPGQTKLPAGVIQLDARDPASGMFNYAANADKTPGAFGSNATYDAARNAYVSKTNNPINGQIVTTTFFEDRREVQMGNNPPSTLYYDAKGNANIEAQAANAKGTRLNFERNFSILDIGSFCPMNALAGEAQCGSGTYDNIVKVEFELLAGSTFALAGVMILDELDDGTIDFFNTARLSKIEAEVAGDPTAIVRISSEGLGGELAVGPNGFSYPSMNAAVPEPASWAMMIGGFALIGGTMRRRAAKIAFA